ncbi:MAG: diaminopimelate epimerase [Candidatus Omnitrophica bacterium]|nr:diaminopimelate epimerase [Candidatus Omnitrophota bacterium]
MKYNIVFTKAVASGNDFIIIDNKAGELDPLGLDYGSMAKDICRRKLSAGADGLLVLESSAEADFKMRIINPDGSEVDMCGNGARCSLLYASSAGWGNELSFETGAGILGGTVQGEKVKVRMTEPADIETGIKLGIGSNMMTVHRINTGVPHVVHIVDDLDGYPVEEMGRKIRFHSMFEPEGTNADFISNPSGPVAEIRTYERGVEGETLACGTGTVASALIAGLLGEASSPLDLRTRSGEILRVYFTIKGEKVSDVYLEGAAGLVYEGKI